ncbi:MAG TPA: pyruvate kinase [Dehalococcoidia bacterium]|nr:pyruvate kinase [Dehalococcoidia bacterium]
MSQNLDHEAATRIADVATTPWQTRDPLKRRRTKIVATLGPASHDVDTIERLILAGVNVFRLNMSHGDHQSHRRAHERVRAAAEKLGEPVAILADLCGPKLRVGKFAGGQIELVSGSHVVVTTRDVVGEPGLIPSQYAGLAGDLRPGDRILLDDGVLELRVEAIERTDVACLVVYGGVLKDRKGMNLPGVNVSAPAMTVKDREDARLALELGVEFLALSFVRRPSDFDELKSLLAATHQDTQVIAKIERPEAVVTIDDILDACDGIMVARGDLGVELPPEIVPVVQRRLVARARAKGKPAIVATQMLESMIDHPRPTRAEVSDVSTAVFSGADAIMLSAETASGAHPVAAVEMMDRVARQIEAHLWEEGAFGSITDREAAAPPLSLPAAIARSTAQLSRDLRVRSVVVLTDTGTTARLVAAARPAAPVIVVGPDLGTCRRSNLLWGTVPVQVDADHLRHPQALARRIAVDLGLAGEGQYLVTIAGFKTSPQESAPTITTFRV